MLVPPSQDEDPILSRSFLDIRFGNRQTEDLLEAHYSMKLYLSDRSPLSSSRAIKDVSKSVILEEPEWNWSEYFKDTIKPKIKWTFTNLITLLVGYSCFSSIYYAALGNTSDVGPIVSNVIVEFLFFISFILNFFKEYKDPATGKTVTDFERVAKNYLSGWFWPDFIALIPLQLIHHKFYIVKLLRLSRFADFLEFFNITAIHQYITSFDGKGSRSSQIETQFLLKYLYKVFRLVIINFLITYFLGLTMYIISDSLNEITEENTFIKVYGFDQMSDYEVVVRCMYFILTTISTVGLGDYLPQTSHERIYVIAVELFGVAFYSYVMGNFLETIANYEKKVGVDDREIELQHWLNVIDKFNARKALDPKLISDIEKHFKYFWKEYRIEGIAPDDPILMSLPKNTRHYFVVKYMFLDLLYEFRTFFNDDYRSTSEFVYFLTFGFLPRKFEKGEVIYQEDEMVEELYLIHSGTVSVGFHIKGDAYDVVELGAKSSFGEYYIIKHKKSEFIYEAKTDVEAIGITNEYFLKALETYPKKGEKVKEKAIERYIELQDAMNTEKNKILKKQAKVYTNYTEEPGDLVDLELGTMVDNGKSEMEVETDQAIRNMIDQVEANITGFEQMLEEIHTANKQDLETYSSKLKNSKNSVHLNKDG